MAVKLPFAVPETFANASDDDLSGLLAKVRAAATDFSTMNVEDLSDDDMDTMQELGKIAKDITAERTSRGAAKSREEKAAGSYAALIDALDTADEAFASADAESNDDTEAPPPAEPAPTPPPPAPPKAKPAAPRVAAVAAAANRTGASLSRAVPAEGEQRKASLVAAAGAPGFRTGEAVDWTAVGQMVENNWRAYQGMGTANKRDGIAQIKIDYPEELTASGGMESDATSIIDYAKDEKRLPGGSLLASIDIQNKARANNALTAAGIGWCAPSEILYDLCELESNDGMLDVPEINVNRGGIKYTAGPDFRSIFNGTGYFHYTEAQVISGVTKPTMTAVCPTFTDTRLEADGLAITADLLSLRGYPELIARFVRGAMVAHNHKLNAFVVNAMVTGSTALTLPSGVASHTPILATSVWGTDHSVASMLLSAIDMAITDYKYGSRMSLNATLEVVLPVWVQSWIRADVQRRAFYDGDGGTDQFAITMAKINDWLRARNARVQWIYDWQDSFYWATYSSGAPSAWQQFGASTANTDFLQDWPHTVQFLLYAAGTWVRGNSDIITLDTVYDSTLLAQNKATQLFTEQGILVAKTCVDSRVYTIAGGAGGLVPSGANNYAPTAQPAWTNP